MKPEFKTLYNNISLLFNAINECPDKCSLDLIETSKGMAIANKICYYDKTTTYEEVESLKEIIKCFKNRIKTGFESDFEKHQEVQNILFSRFEKELYCISNKIGILPLKIEGRKKAVKALKRICEIADTFDGCTRQELLSTASLIAYFITCRFTQSSIKEKSSLMKIISKIEGKCDTVNLGDKTSSKKINPDALRLIAEMINEIPELWEGEHFRKITVENVFLNQVYRGLSGGMLESDAIKESISGVKDNKIKKYLKNLVRDIKNSSKIAVSLCKEKKNNSLAFFQKEAVYRFFTNKKNFLFLFDDPGTRKTITSSLSMVSKMMRDGYSSGRILIVSPNNVRDNWVDEIQNRIKGDNVCVTDIHKDFSLGGKIDGKFHFEVIGNSLFQSNKFEGLDFDNYDGIIVDEAHNFKQRESQREHRKHSVRSKNLTDVIGLIKYRIIQTGTPVVNEPYEYATIINNYSGEKDEVISIAKLKSIPLRHAQGCYIYVEANKFVVRRHKRDILNLPEMKVKEIDVIIGEKELKEWGSFREEYNHMARIAQYESMLKLKTVNKIINEHKKEKGLVFSYYIGTNDGLPDVEYGILTEFYEKSKCDRKIYIAGDKIYDINGSRLDYNTENACIVRKQFHDCKTPVVAYISIGTCREGINEFKVADYAVHLILPFEPASFDQANTRIYRQGREDKDCTIYIPVVKFRRPNGKYFYKESDNKKVFSFDESCLRLIKVKKQLSHITCDGTMRRIDDSLMYYDIPEGEKYEQKLLRFVSGENYITQPNLNWHVVNFVKTLTGLSDRDTIIAKIKMFDDDMLNTVDDEFVGFYKAMSGFDASVKTKKECKKLYKKVFGNKRIRVAHVGSGACQWDNEFLGCSMTKFDYIYEADDVITCDRSELDGLEDDSTDMILATHVMHWGANEINQTITMNKFNAVLKDDGILFLTCPLGIVYPFACQKGILRNKGFELLEEITFGENRGYVLKKVSSANEDKAYLNNHLPKKVKK